ncbi:PREDICTED: uncharacterized protein LOC108967536 [Bactrocera latifrons]|uniref:uncharacterized protein LOC108967536 n=1 Tax=Bactrocera latifrons TaxID=174628 RepID=UPI0008DDE542|nr:PREDICTED: uncharacterized protein LOC108967536 [Bactrocera latifrons]
MNNKNPDPKSFVIEVCSKSIPEERIEFNKEIKNEIAHDVNNDKIKVFAIYEVIMRLIQSIELSLFAADEKSPMHIAAQMPHNAFMWTKESWQQRVHYGLFWMKVIAKEAANRDWVEERKLQVDLRQLNDFAHSILLSYIGEKLQQEASKKLRSAEEYAELHQSLSNELIANTKQWNKLKEEKGSFDKCTATIKALEQTFLSVNMQALLKQKVKERYLRRHNEVSEEQAKLEADIRIKELIKQIDYYNKRSENDAFISVYKSDVYNNTIEFLRLKIDNIEKKFVTKEIETEDTRQVLQTSIAKLKTKLAYRKAKLRLFRTAVQQYREGALTDFTQLRNSVKSLALLDKSFLVMDTSPSTNLTHEIERTSMAIKAN